MISKIKLNDIAGYDYPKEEANKIVNFFKHYDEYTKQGVELTRGCFFYGEPGNGKTMFAKAIANEAGVKTYILNDAQYQNTDNLMINLKKIFTDAKENAPSILIIDEIDQLVDCNPSYRSNPTDKQRDALRLLLTEIDQLEKTGVLVIATANCRICDVPQALVRNGRIEKLIKIEKPNKNDREQILKMYLDKHKVFKDISPSELAQQTDGFTCSSLYSLVNDVVINALANNVDTVSYKDFVAPIQTIISKGIKATNERDINSTVYHEIGHFLCDYELNKNYGLISIEAYGDSEGRYKSSAEIDSCINTKKEYRNKAIISLGGIAATKVYLNKMYAGGQGDIAFITKIFKAMLINGFGKSSVVVSTTEAHNDYVGGFYCHDKNYVKAESRFYRSCLNEACRIIRKNKALGNRIFEELKNKKTLTIEELKNIVENKAK